MQPDDGLTTTSSINTYDGGQDSLNSTADKENICSVDSAILPPHPRGTDHSAVLAGGSSDDDEMDKKLDDRMYLCDPHHSVSAGNATCSLSVFRPQDTLHQEDQCPENSLQEKVWS